MAEIVPVVGAGLMEFVLDDGGDERRNGEGMEAAEQGAIRGFGKGSSYGEILSFT